MILLLMVGLVGVACDSVSGTPVSTDAIVLGLTPAEVVLAPGKSATLQAKARNSVGAPVQIGLKWRSSDPEIVTVDGHGNVTALRAGEAEVQVVYGKSSGNAKIRVTPEGSGDAKAVASVTLTPEAASLKAIGDTVHLTASALNSAGATVTGAEVTWASLDEMVATVSAGTVVARGNGTARVTATAGGKVDTAVVTVAQAPVSVSVMPGAVSLLPGQSVQLAAVAVDANGVSILGHSFTWATENGGIATVEAGKVVAVTTGSTIIRATSGSLSGAATIAVQNTPVATVAVSPASGYIEVGQTGQLTVTLKDASGNVVTGRAVSWTSSNGSVATVSSTGAVTGASAGTTTISATSEGKTGTATLEVRAPAPAPVASVTVSPGSASVEKGKTVALSATTKDASGNVLTGRAVSWSSSNASVASVSSSGVVTGVAGGTATIVATSEGKSGSASITVTVPTVAPAPVASVQVSPSSVSVEKGKSASFTATLRDASGNVLTGRTISWTSSNPAVATVSSSGVATGVGAGSATIAATSEGKTGYASLTVSEPATGGDGGGANEPSGMTVFVRQNGDTKNWGTGWRTPCGTDCGRWFDNAYVQVVADTNNPTGSGSAIEYRFPAGSVMSDYRHMYSLDSFTQLPGGFKAKELYIRVRMRLSPEYQISTTANPERAGMKLFGYWGHDGDRSAYFLDNEGGRSLPWKIRMNSQPFNQGQFIGNSGGDTGSHFHGYAGGYNTVEIHQVAQSSPGAGDGSIKVWVNGVLVTNHTGMKVPDATKSNLLDGIEFGPMRGHDNAALPKTDWIRIGEFYVSAK